MQYLSKLKGDIEKFGSENNQEMAFLFESLTHSLKTALKQAKNLNLARCTPSTKHTVNLSRLLYKNLSSVPVPSIANHMDDLFAYIEETLQSNLTLPIAEDFEELIILVEELEKAVKVLLKPVEKARSYASTDGGVASPNISNKAMLRQYLEETSR